MGPGCPAKDTDNDTIPDYFDNCTYIANGPAQDSDQIDSDLDGFGNACDYDFMQYGKLPTAAEWANNEFWLNYAIDNNVEPVGHWASMDMTGDGVIDVNDLNHALIGRLYQGLPGHGNVMMSGLEGTEEDDCADPTLMTETSFPTLNWSSGWDDSCPARTPWWW